MTDLFWVLDKKTGKQAKWADIKQLVLKSHREKSWAHGLIWCDLEDWAIEPDGTLVLLDECGNYAYPPERFEVVWGKL